MTAATGMALFVKLTNNRLGLASGVSTWISGWTCNGLGARHVRSQDRCSFFCYLTCFLPWFSGCVMLIILGSGGILRLEVEPIEAIMNVNLPVWGGLGCSCRDGSGGTCAISLGQVPKN